eukprot:GSChrysophyteH1.ASY1.ANO1.1114.1 assembled CDS
MDRHPYKCPCCSNPWQASEGTAGSGGVKNEYAGFVKSFALCGVCMSSNDDNAKGLDPANFDNTIRPQDDFYLYSNGGWKEGNPCPAAFPRWGVFNQLADKNQERLKEILESLEKGEISDDPSLKDDCKKLCDFYTFLHQRGVDVLFDMGSGQHQKNSDHTMAFFSQSGLGLPDRDYYFDEDKEEKREKYQRFIADILNLSSRGNEGFQAYSSQQSCRIAAQKVFSFEKQLATVFWTRTELRDVNRKFNNMQLVTSSQTWTFDFQCGLINVSTPEPIAHLGNLLQKNIADGTLSYYLTFHVLSKYSQHLGKDWQDLHFTFKLKTLQGAKEVKERWKRVLEFQEKALGDAMGKLYVSKYFDESCKKKALGIVENVKDALRQRLGEVDWMSEATRKEALLKMEKFRVKIGYPDVWTDFSDLPVVETCHTENVIASNLFWFSKDVARINKQTDRERWFMVPQMVNAYYHPMLNEIVFPAAILQPPFFDAEADLAVQFGGFGAVVGHEMTHGFDDKGREYDKDGALQDWWTKEDSDEYKRRAQTIIDQASAHTVFGQNIKGEFTQGENIADLGGVKLALRALKKRLESEPKENIRPLNGFTPLQRFFLAWSQVWRQNSTKENALAMVTLDPHGPSELRCNNTVSNVPEFLEAFNVGPEDPMGKYHGEGSRVEIW